MTLLSKQPIISQLIISILIDFRKARSNIMTIPLHLLLQRATQAQRKMARPWMEVLNLSPGQPKILFYLAENNGCIQRELASVCAIEPATVSKLLDNMEEQGLIQRLSSDGCKRAVLVKLTARGEERAKQAREIYKKIENRGQRNFSSLEWQQFRDFLERLYLNFSESADQ